MNVNILYKKENEELQPKYYQCGCCNTIYSDKQYAEECCKPLTCSICGKEIRRERYKCYDRYYGEGDNIKCVNCHDEEKWNNLPVITEEAYNKLSKEDPNYGPVCLDNEFEQDLYGLLEYIAGDYEEAPEYVQVARYEKIKPLKIDGYLEAIIEDMCLDDEPYIEDVFENLDELYAFIQKWNKKQTYRYIVPEDRKIKLSEETKKEYFNDQP